MVKRFVYLSVSTHTLILYPYLLLYPIRGASRVTHMLALIADKDTALGWPVPEGSSIASQNRGFSIHTGLGALAVLPIIFVCGASVCKWAFG